jgi:hypothetical protein
MEIEEEWSLMNGMGISDVAPESNWLHLAKKMAFSTKKAKDVTN